MQGKKQGWHHLVLALVAASLVSSIQGQDAASTTAAANPAALATIVSAVANSTAAGEHGSNGRISCRVHVANNTGSPTTFSHVQSSLKISSAADVTDVSVIVQVQHPDVATLEVVLSAAASSSSSRKVILKSPAVGVVGGANMVQTIFSDWAPVPFPSDASESPYSSVYRPTQPLHSLASGNSTAAGAGGSKGVWTLSVTDKATGDLSRRPLKLTGWELWLCGESNGPLFAPVDGKGDIATAFDGSDQSTSVVKKAVATSKKVDVNVLVKSGYRAEQVAEDPINHVIHTINSYLAKGLAAHFKKASASLKQANPELAAHLSSAMEKVQSRLQGLPALMGYEQGADGSWGLPTSEAMITGFLDTLTHCYYDLYWCWENTGLRGNLALDFASTWDASSGPAAAAWSATQKEWSSALAGFEAAFPELNSWSDVLFYSVIDTLYTAAAADAVATVEEAYFDTAIRLAIYASPIRFAVNPRAAIVQTFSVLSDAVNDVFLALEFAPELVDNNNNNDVAAITAIATALANGARSTLSLLTRGLSLRADGMQQVLSKSAGALATRAAEVNDELSQAIAQVSPDLGAVFEAATQPASDVLRSIAQSRQDTMQQYFKSQNNKQVLGSELNRSIDLVGNVTVSMATRAAEAFKTAQNALDEALPGPSLEMVIGNLRGNITGILDDARKALENLLPIPELKEFDQLMRATIDSIVELLNESAKQVQTSDGAKAIQKQLNALAEGLNRAQRGVGEVFNGIVKGFPGPLLNSTIGVIQREANKAISNVNNLFKQLNKDFPNLDPKKFIEQLGKILDQLLSDTLGQTNAFQAMAPFGAAQQLSAALPGLLAPVGDALQQTQLLANAALPTSVTGGISSTKLSEIQKGIKKTLKNYSKKLGAITRSLPVQPPVANITDNLTQRSQQVGQQVSQQSSQFVQAVANGLSQPYKIMTAGVSDLNSNLEALLRDLESQSSRVDELSKVLAQGPLQDIPLQLDETLGNVLGGFQDAAQSLEDLLPDLPDLRKQLDALLGPPLKDLDAQLQLASKEALKAAKAASNGLVSDLATALPGINRMLIDGQWQLAGLLGSVVQATKQLDTAASALNQTLAPQLQSLDRNMAELAKSVSSDLEERLAALRPPIAVLENLIRPLASALNAELGNITQILTLSGPNVQMGVNGVLQQLQMVAGSLVNSASAALGLPPLPQLPFLPGMNASLLNSTLPLNSTGQLVNITQLLTVTAQNVQMGVNGVLQQLQALADSLVNSTLGSFGLPTNPLLPGMNASLLNSTLSINSPAQPVNITQLLTLGDPNVLQQLQALVNSLTNSTSGSFGLPTNPLLPGMNASLLNSTLPINSPAQPVNITQLLTLGAPNVLQQLQALVNSLINSTSVALGLPNPQLPSLNLLPGTPVSKPNSPMQTNTTQVLNSTSQLGSIIQILNSTGQLGNIIQVINSTGQLSNITQIINSAGQLGNIIQMLNSGGQLGNIIQMLNSTGQLGSIMQMLDSTGQLGKIIQVLNLNGPSMRMGVNGVLQQLPTVAGNLIKPRSGALGRHLLQSSDDVSLPILEVAFNIPDLTSVSGANGTFDPVAFRQAVASGVEDAVNSFANDFVGSVLGLRGVSQLDGVNSVMQSLSNTVNNAVKQLRDSAAGLPKGPVFEFLTTGNKETLQPLKQLQQTLVTAMNGPAANDTAIDPSELSALFSQAGGILQSLGGPVQQMARTANSGDVVKQLAQQFTTVADAAGKMLEGMKGNLHSWSSQLA